MFACGTSSPTPEQTGTGGGRRKKLQPFVRTRFRTCLRPAAPPVERGTLWIDTVKRGSMTRDVNAPGTLEPEYVRNVVALTSGRVEDLPVQPGINVTSTTLLVVLDNPDVRLSLLQDQQALSSAYS